MTANASVRCAVCGAAAPIATHYALPEIQRTPTGYVNLVACSPACRETWQAQRAARDAEIIVAQQSAVAQQSFAHARAARQSP